MNNRNGKFDIYYHIFADNKDYYEGTLKDANNRFNILKKDGEPNIRLYQCWFDSKEHAIKARNGSYSYDNEIEDCLRSIGGFPM